MPVRGAGLVSVRWPFSGTIAGHFQAPLLVIWFVYPLATWFRHGELGLMGRPYTLESLGGKQGKLGGLMVQTPGAKCGDRGQVKRALQISVTEGSGHVCPGKLNRPPLPSGDRGAGCDGINRGAWCEISGEVEHRSDRRQIWDIRVEWGIPVRVEWGIPVRVEWGIPVRVEWGIPVRVEWDDY